MIDAPIEWAIVIVVILVLFGSTKKIPEFARNLGRATGEFKRGQVELENELRKSMSPDASSVKPAEINYGEAAKNLGIDTAGKNEEQIKTEIREKLSNNQ
ncbi:MAG: twin-arginine translocase TatA/TatE family subunit [Thermoplasmataceae archaeon]|jgi:sec-independent protein translocase protein TatA|nr:twin-arginine translocase TatA/TatE family subunit [Candidatus Thermoplasmatota archaeon]